MNPAASPALRRFARRLQRDRRGLALTEFAMSLPILGLLCVTGIEFANYARTCMSLSQMALSAADNAGRIQDRIDEADVDSIFIGTRNAGEGIRFGPNGRIIMSMVEVNGQPSPNTGQKITWSRCYGAKIVASTHGNPGDGATDASLVTGVGPPGKKITAEAGTGVMYVEIVYDYQPLFPVTGFMIDELKSNVLRYTAAFPVRERADNALTNGFAFTDAQKRLCTHFTAT